MKMLLLGDVCPTDESNALFAAGDTAALFGGVKPLFDQADWSFVNLECAITDSDNAIKKFGPNLKAPRLTARILKELGVDCCGMSNNHIFDFGKEGALDTMRALQQEGIAYTGFGDNYDDSRRDLVVERDGQRIAIIAVCEHEYSYALDNRMGSRPYDVYDTVADVRRAKEQADRVVVLYHGGKEMCQYPSPRVRRLCRVLVDNGADVVLAQHSHCIATYERYNGGHILHGQGNFHFSWGGWPEIWYSCLAATYDTVTGELELTPLVIDGNAVRPANEQEAHKINDAFRQRNEELADGRWKDGWHRFCVSQKYYLERLAPVCTPDATQEQNDLFGHYLDCEAHTDVYRELFPTYNQTNEL